MRKWIKAFVFLWVFTGFISTPLKAEESAAPAASPKLTLTGEVVSVDVNARTLTAKDTASGQTVVFDTNKKTVTSRNNLGQKLEDARVGEKVIVEYTEEGGKKTATAVTELD